jgi:hypothetical protein
MMVDFPTSVILQSILDRIAVAAEVNADVMLVAVLTNVLEQVL